MSALDTRYASCRSQKFGYVRALSMDCLFIPCLCGTEPKVLELSPVCYNCPVCQVRDLDPYGCLCTSGHASLIPATVTVILHSAVYALCIAALSCCWVHRPVSHETRPCDKCRVCTVYSCGALMRTAAFSSCRLGGVMKACHTTSASAAELTCLPMRPCQQAPLREHTLHNKWLHQKANRSWGTDVGRC